MYETTMEINEVIKCLRQGCLLLFHYYYKTKLKKYTNMYIILRFTFNFTLETRLYAKTDIKETQKVQIILKKN